MTSAVLLGRMGAAGATPTAPAGVTATSVSGLLSGGGKTGKAIAVPVGTAVTSTAKLAGTNVATATGTVTYTVYDDEEFTSLVATAGTVTVVQGVVPKSPAVTRTLGGSYFWRASYSGDASHAASKSICGAAGEVETMSYPPPARAATSVSGTLSGSWMTGTAIWVSPGTPVMDSGRLAGANAATALGTATYRVYSDAKCSRLVGNAGTVKVGGGIVPNSAAVSLTKTGTYYWRVSYSGDAEDDPSTSGCGAEKVTVGVPTIDTAASALGKTSTAVRVSTAAADELLVAYVAGKGPSGKGQTATVSSSGLTWTLLARSNAGSGDAEVWYVRADTKIAKVGVTAKEKYAGWPIDVTVVAYKYATGLGARATTHSSKGAPAGSVTTSQADSWVFAVGVDWARSAARPPGAGQSLVRQATGSAGTYWVQSTDKITPNAWTKVTIHDSKPTTDPYDLLVVDIG